LPTPQSQIAALHTILSKSLNVRQTEELVRRLTALSAEEKQTSAHSKTSPPELKDIEEKFRSKFNTRVDLLKRNKGGTITFHFYSDEELNELIHMLLGDI
jgi:ParB family chromosome partitioning protein